MNCPDAYREALIRQFAATMSAGPDSGQDDVDGRLASAASYVADPDDPSAER
jgi:hypothetical protein